MRLKNRIWEESENKGIIGLITFILFFLSFFLPQARAQIEAQGSTAETQIAQIEVKYAQLAEQDRAKKILSTRTAHDKKYNIETHTEIGIREFFNALSEVYSLEEIQRGLSELFDKPNRATGKPYSFDQKALNLNEILYGQSDRMTWREEAVLIWFQSKHGIDEHGDGGPKTWAKLRELQKERELAQPEYTPNLEELPRVRRMLHEQEQLLRYLRAQTRRAPDYEEAAGQRNQE